MTNPELLKNLRKRMKQQIQVKDVNFVLSQNELLHLFCENDTKLTWDEVFDTLIGNENSRVKQSLSMRQMVAIAELIKSNIVTHVDEIEVKLDNNQLKEIVRIMPVIYFNNEKCSSFVNLHELVMTPGILECLLFPDNVSIEEPGIDNSEPVGADSEEPNNSQENQTKSRRGIGGQPSFIFKFPEIIGEVTVYVKHHNFAAQARRWTDTGFSSGISIAEIRNHLYEKFPDLKSHIVSLTTIRRLFEAPNKSVDSRHKYTRLINARVGAKSNSYREPHLDAHYLFARNKMRREMAAMLSNSIKIISMDDMAKIKVGPPAVSRYHQLKQLFPSADQPNFSDHDFPIPGYYLNVSGYMELDCSHFEPNTMVEFNGLNSTSVYDYEKKHCQHNRPRPFHYW